MKLNNNYNVTKSRAIIYPKNKDGDKIKVSYDPYLFGLILGIAKRREHNWHGLILITGEVGDGKSTLGDGICGLDSYFFKKSYNIDNIVFSTTKFEELTDKTDNFYEPIKYDEAIEGATAQDMARSSKGLSFKKKIIQKRKKKHLYVMCVDELEEYAWKLVKMADVWIHVKSFGLNRGYFDIYAKKSKIKTKYLAMKNKQYYLANKIYPDKSNCRFMNYENIFVDDNLYQQKKDEETKSVDTKKKESKNEQRNEAIIRALNTNMTQIKVAEIFGVSQSLIRDIKRKYKDLVVA